MKKCIASLLVSLPVFLLAQGVDSIAMRQVDSLILVSRDFTAKMDYDKALEVNASAERIALEIFGSESAAYGSFCFNQGRILYFKGDHAGAEKWYLEAKAIREMVPGEEHYDYAGILHNLATLYLDMGDFEKAEPLYVAVKIIREKKQGKDHPLYVSCLNNLALLYKEMGYLEKAEPLHLEAIDIRARTIGREHPNYALSLNNLAILYREMGKFEKAEPLYLESLDIRGTFFGREHPDYASSLNNLAIFYMSLGNYHNAESLYLEAKSIFEATIGREHPNYASSLSNLALLYMYMGNYGQAEPLWIETIGIRSKTLGREHPEYASGLYNLANLYSQKGDFERAMSCYLESMAIRQRVLGVEHYDYAQILFAMGDLYAQMDDFGKAEALYLEAEDIREKSLGKDHPDYVQSLDHLADLYERQSRSLEAEPLLEESLTLSQARMVNATTFLSEQELAQYAGNFLRRGDKLGSYLIGRLTDNLQLGKLPSLAYDHALFYKGFLLTAATRWNAPGLESPESLETYLRLKGYRRRLAVEYTLPVAERKGIADLEEKANIAEKELARMVTGYVEAIRQANFQEVKSTLAPDAMALEFVHFRVNFPTVTDSVMYAAMLLRPGAGEPVFIPLFEEGELHHLLDDHKERRADYVNELYARADRGTVKLGGEKKSLYDLIWAKIEAAGLEGIKTVYYSPSGVLHRLNLGAIAVDEETILSDKYNLVALNSTRQLVIPTTVTTKANDALLVGGVNFEMDSVQTSLKGEPLMAIRSSAGSWTESGTRGGSWSYLRWTEKEVERIVTSLTTAGFDAVQITGADATEEAIKSIGTRGPSPRILHIATHGFFFPDPEIDPSSRRGLGEGEPVFKSSDNPMIRSGLILSGGNYAWQHGRPVSPDREDGILTAYEISQMNLANTELVVLSACETGLGDIQGNEGVYGLQRAFKIAGAKYLIMSLWQVPDRETMEFMTAFYRNWLEEKRTIPEAFRKTQRELRDRFINPYSWAGFVLVE